MLQGSNETKNESGLSYAWVTIASERTRICNNSRRWFSIFGIERNVSREQCTRDPTFSDKRSQPKSSKRREGTQNDGKDDNLFR